MEDNNFNVLVDAKTEYTKQLVTILTNSIYKGIYSMYIETKEYCINNNENDKVLINFQYSLSQIPKWNQELINNETERIVNETGCDWLDDLVTAVFVSHTRILTSINNNKNKKRIDLKIPKLTHFIHKCYIDIARSFWKNVYLFNDKVSKIDFQRNRREAENIIASSINETIRKQLPVKHILKEYLGNEYEYESDNDMDSKMESNKNLKKMVKREIKTCSEDKLNHYNNEIEDTSLEKPTKVSKVNNELLDNLSKVSLDKNNKDITTFSKQSLDSPHEIVLTKNDDIPIETPIEVSLDTPIEVSLDTPKVVTVNNHTDDTTSILEEMKTKSNKYDNKSDLSDNDLNELINKELENNNLENNNLENNDLQLDELNLDGFDDLNKLEEMYLENNSNNSNKQVNVKINNTQEDISDTNIKKIFIDNGKKTKEKNPDFLKKYSVKKRNIEFFDDSDD